MFLFPHSWRHGWSVPQRSTHKLTNNRFDAVNIFTCIHSQAVVNASDIVALISELLKASIQSYFSPLAFVVHVHTLTAFIYFASLQLHAKETNAAAHGHQPITSSPFTRGRSFHRNQRCLTPTFQQEVLDVITVKSIIFLTVACRFSTWLPQGACEFGSEPVPGRRY